MPQNAKTQNLYNNQPLCKQVTLREIELDYLQPHMTFEADLISLIQDIAFYSSELAGLVTASNHPLSIGMPCWVMRCKNKPGKYYVIRGLLTYYIARAVSPQYKITCIMPNRKIDPLKMVVNERSWLLRIAPLFCRDDAHGSAFLQRIWNMSDSAEKQAIYGTTSLKEFRRRLRIRHKGTAAPPAANTVRSYEQRQEVFQYEYES